MSFAPDLATSTNPDLDLLVDIHRYKRPKGSRMEQAFIETFLLPLGVRQDLYGNLHKVVVPEGAADTYMPSVIFSSHTDTVHTAGGFQRVVVDANGMMTVHKREDTNCLGADDGAGVWLMMEMIKAGVPGWYIFHYGEEKGCEGSTKLSNKHPELFKDIKIAIAFDRKFYSDVITKMSGQKVCSDEFADSLILQLPKSYHKDPGGSRTDVALYKGLIPECTNISVGYFEPHMKTERLDTKHLINLRDHLIKLDTTKLVVKRDPKAVETYATHGRHHTNNYSGTGGSNYYKEARPKTFAEFFKECSGLAAEMMYEAGIEFDVFLSLALKQQAKKKRNYNAFDKELIPYHNYKDPIPNHEGIKAPAKEEAETPPASSASTASTASTNVVPMQQQGKAAVPAPVNEGTD